MKLKLRGHHLLCLKGFQGYGYDESFVENMTHINSLRKKSTTTIILLDSPDDICSSCPNLKGNLCQNKKQDENIISMDREILKKLDQKKEYDSLELFEVVGEIFNTKDSVSKICYNCMWHEKCLFYQNL